MFNEKIIDASLLYFYTLKPDKLYRFRTANDCNLKNLVEDKIWFSNPNNFNDDLDTTIELDYQTIYEKDLKTYSCINVMCGGESIEEMKANGTYLCFQKFVKNESKKAADALKENVKNSILSACLTTTFNKYMWENYANHGSGFCLEFNTNRLFENRNISLFPILYTQEKPVLKKMTPEQLQKVCYAMVFKGMKFSQEHEWRLSYKWTQPEDMFEKDSVPKKDGMNLGVFKPEKVYLGYDMDSAIKQRVIEICTKKQIEYVQESA